MLRALIDWWASPETLALRLSAGAAFFVALAGWDIYRHGRRATRWREYLFLLAGVAAAVAFGVVNDQLTAFVSWEYFYYGKGIFEAAPSYEAMSAWDFRLRVARVAVAATWWVGLILAAVQLFVNSVACRSRRLGFAALAKTWPIIAAGAALCGVLGGLCGYYGAFAGFEEFGELVKEDLFRPRRFMAVWGVNLGEYIGGLAGMIAGGLWIFRQRRGAPAALSGSERQ